MKYDVRDYSPTAKGISVLYEDAHGRCGLVSVRENEIKDIVSFSNSEGYIEYMPLNPTGIIKILRVVLKRKL